MARFGIGAHQRLGNAHVNPWLPTGYIRENFDRRTAKANIAPCASGTETFTGCDLFAGDVLSHVSVFSQATGISVATNQYMVLRDLSFNRLALTADDGSLGWANPQQKQFYFSRSVTDASITSGQAVVNSATAAFTQADVGKQVTFMGAGAAGVPLGGAKTFNVGSTGQTVVNAGVTILSVQSATQATLSANASTTVASGGTFYIATPYTVTADGGYYFGLMPAAITVPTLYGLGEAAGTILDLAPALSYRDTGATGLTTPATSPTPSTTPFRQNGCFYVLIG